MTSLAPLLEAFFTERLCKQRRASPNTISAYRDTFRLLLGFAERRLTRQPSVLALDDLDATVIGAFLDELETERDNSVRTRNARLAAIRSFFRFAAVREPGQSAVIQRVLAIPQKRFDRNIVQFLTRPEIEALLAAPDQAEWIGRRDHALLLLAIQTGLRVSELIGVQVSDLVLETGAHVRCRGKGRKERCTPLTRQAVQPLRAWLRERGGGESDPVFPSRRGGRLSRDAVEHLVTKYAAIGARTCPSLSKKQVSPHVLRHTTAVLLLRAGVDQATIALWLGHESIETTQIYLDADLSTKEAAIARTAPPSIGAARYKPGDQLLLFLNSL
ncbi:MAG TPA: site-specific integrase [Planctomycetota bacterium]|nr:site-specific integrase [Planctomycetota bacterium]